MIYPTLPVKILTGRLDFKLRHRRERGLKLRTPDTTQRSDSVVWESHWWQGKLHTDAALQGCKVQLFTV